MKPTGRQRHRSHKLFGGPYVCVLQFEYEHIHTTCVAGHVDSEWRKSWFDARPAQLTIEGESPYVHASSKTVGSNS